VPGFVVGGRHGPAHQVEDYCLGGGNADGVGLGGAGPRLKGDGCQFTGPMRYLMPSIHSVSACEPRPSDASTAAL
jgi:hypothetical protein